MLELHSTYWRIRGSSNPAAVRRSGSSSVSTSGPCVPPGSGCGTIRAPFRAVGAGTATLSAHRTTCGEALRCSPARSRFSVSIKVHE